MGRLEGKRAIVTGAAQGIGRAIAHRYAQEGARVAIVDISADAARKAATEINDEVKREAAIALEADVSDKSSTEHMTRKVVEAFRGLDILVNNAALWKQLERRPFWDIPVEEWDRVFAVNTRGPFLCSAAVAPHLIAQSSGKIVIIGSATVWTAQSTLTHYTSSKAALIGLVRCLAREFGPYNISVNMIHPGLTDTGGMTQEYLKARSTNRLMPRVQAPGDLTGAAVFLASSDSDFITGQQMHVDGGLVLV